MIQRKNIKPRCLHSAKKYTEPEHYLSILYINNVNKHE